MNLISQETALDRSSIVLREDEAILTPSTTEAQPSPTPQWRSSPMTPGATMLYFDPALAKEVGVTEAIVLQKVWDWMECNRINNSRAHFINGQWYTYNSAREWRDNHFTHLSVDTVKAAFRWLEEKGYIARTQHHAYKGDCRQWVTIPADAKARIDALSEANTPPMDDSTRGVRSSSRGVENPPRGVRNDPPTNKNLQIQNDQTKSVKPQTTTTANAPAPEQETEGDPQTAEKTVVVVTPPHREPEAISGEHSLDGEGAQTAPRTAKASSALVKAMHKDGSNDENPSKSSAKRFPLLVAELSDFGVAPYVAQRLVNQYPSDDVRYILAYARGEGNLKNPPGFVVDELDHGKAGVLAKRNLDQKKMYVHEIDALNDDFVQEYLHEPPAPPAPPPGSDVIVKESPAGVTTAGQAWVRAQSQIAPDIKKWHLMGAQLAAYDVETHTYHITVESVRNAEALQQRSYRLNIENAVRGSHNGPFSLVFSADSGAGQTVNSDQSLNRQFA